MFIFYLNNDYGWNLNFTQKVIIQISLNLFTLSEFHSICDQCFQKRKKNPFQNGRNIQISLKMYYHLKFTKNMINKQTALKINVKNYTQNMTKFEIIRISHKMCLAFLLLKSIRIKLKNEQ